MLLCYSFLHCGSDHLPTPDVGCKKLWWTPLQCTFAIKEDTGFQGLEIAGKMNPTSSWRTEALWECLILKTKNNCGARLLQPIILLYHLPWAWLPPRGGRGQEVPQTLGLKLTRGISTHRAAWSNRTNFHAAGCFLQPHSSWARRD